MGNKGGLPEDEVQMNCMAVDNQLLKEQVQDLFRRDFLVRDKEWVSPEKSHPSIHDQHALRQMEQSIRFDESIGRYRVGLPWKENREAAAKRLNDIDTLSSSRNRLIKMAARLKRDPERKEGVLKSMAEIIDLGHATPVEPSPVQEGIPRYYIPLHVDNRKPGKWRICHDALSKVNGVCLNDQLLSGPDFMNNLVGVLMRFRRHEVAISADIKGFFHHIYVDEKDVEAFRFWWFKDPENLKDLCEFQTWVHVFGAKSSSGVSGFTLRYHGKKHENEISLEVAMAIQRSFYVDDFLGSFPDVETARKTRIGLTKTLKKGGFELLKWKSTHPQVLEDGVSTEDDDEDQVMVLQDKESYMSAPSEKC